MDEALRNAIARQEALVTAVEADAARIRVLQNAIDRGRAELDRVSAFITTWYEMAGIQPPPLLERVEINSDVPPPSRRPKNPDRDFVVDASLEVIRAAGKPLSRRILFEALAQRGITIHGKDPEMVLSTMLWRSQDRVVRLPQYGYWDAQEDWVAAGYIQINGEELKPAVRATEPEDGVEADDVD